jgi:anti-sigma regulatory factor (Ser/Thr protein kinase)
MEDDVSDSSGISTPADEQAVGRAPQVHLRLPAIPANVALVRQAFAGLAEELELDPSRVGDIKIALTEACTNAVVHAYDSEGGPLTVTMAVEHGRLVLTIRDRGHGLRPLPSADSGPPLGFGLALIASLSDEFGVAGGPHGTEVRIAFSLDHQPQAPPLAVQVAADEPWPHNETIVELSAGDHAAAVLSRIVSLVAARADFSIDRLSDAQIVSDAIAGAAGAHTLDGLLRIAIDEHDDGFDLVVGPLADGGGTRLVHDTELPGLGRLLERLTDALAVEPSSGDDGGEQLRARLLTRF